VRLIRRAAFRLRGGVRGPYERTHVVPVYVTCAPYSAEEGQRITQLHRFLLAQKD
jgi:hypothetical protein